MTRSLTALLVTALLASMAAGQEPLDEERVGRWIEQLADGEWSVRQEATEALVGLGPDVLPFLRRAEGHPDPEVRSRVLEIARQVGEVPRAHLQRILTAALPPELRKELAEKPIRVNVRDMNLRSFARLMQATSQVTIELAPALARSTATVSMSGGARPLGVVLAESLGPEGIVFTAVEGKLHLVGADEVLQTPATIGLLIDSLESEDAEIRVQAVRLLRLLTTERHGFRAGAGPAERAEALAAWRAWYQNNAAGLVWNAGRMRFEVDE